MSEDQKIVLQSLSQDLLRVAMGRHRKQKKMAARFTEEAKARLHELNEFDQGLILKIEESLNSVADRSAEDLLMYSTLVRNRAF